jgi:hypothetical protein
MLVRLFFPLKLVTLMLKTSLEDKISSSFDFTKYALSFILV